MTWDAVGTYSEAKAGFLLNKLRSLMLLFIMTRDSFHRELRVAVEVGTRGNGEA